MTNPLLISRKIAKQLVGSMIVFSLVSISVGCSGSVAVKPSDPETAANLTSEVFQQWKDGKAVSEIRNADPPIYVVEDLWVRGYQLTDFSIERPPELSGTNVRMHMKLHVRDQAGRAFSRSQKYLVTTTPAITIAQED